MYAATVWLPEGREITGEVFEEVDRVHLRCLAGEGHECHWTIERDKIIALGRFEIPDEELK
jgi:hypothetical protein